MVNMTVRDVLLATGGTLLSGDENTILTDVCVDSRTIKEGDLFIPLVGNNSDGHRFIESALKVGAATLTSQHKDVVISDKAYIKVDDVEKALQDIGLYIRNRYSMPVVGVTGSVGKTTTREMITAAIAVDRPCFHTEGNLNSQQGVPITLSRMTDEYEAAVIEMGISDPGQMKILSSMVKPDIAVVTMIGVAHMEMLKTKENIRREKLDIISSMSENGILFLNGDDELLNEVKNDMPCKTMTFGMSEDCDFRAENIRFEGGYTVYEAVHGDLRETVKVKALGKHNVRNSLVGMAVALQLGIPFEKSAKAFESFTGLRQQILSQEGRYTVIDDTYNASPDSMKACIDVLCDINCKGKKYAVLGDMFELGENSIEFHRQIGEYLRDKKVDVVYTIGENAYSIKEALDECDTKHAVTKAFMDKSELGMYLLGVLEPEDVVIIKASNGMHLNEVVKILMN